MLAWLEDEEEDEEEGNLDSIEPRLAFEKVPAVAWRDYIDCIRSGRAKQAEAKLSKVRVAINEVISTATFRGFTAKLRTWKAVLGARRGQ